MIPKTKEDPVKLIEKKYPQTARAFKAYQREQYELFCRKQLDYGPNNVALGQNLETDEGIDIAMQGILIRMSDKVNRLINLIIKEKKTPQNESIMDSYGDLSVYGIMASIVKDGFWGK
jgi:hypothetical protein